ncbi:MAG: peptidyl-prolyl cis-trans isomerase [Pirellulaceae bacterium]|nr:MAG: peptidyl-prolyl cis-trans isomerase [Pirellulaceae bacterium]
MGNRMVRRTVVFLIGILALGRGHAAFSEENPVVVIKTNLGEIKAELFAKEAPITTKNFLEYAKSGFYDGTIFHRVIDGFMIQGGGFDKNMRQKQTKDPIKNEAGNNLSNKKYTLAMARTSVPDSATSQFFINVADNDFLDRKHAQDGVGYAVFGRVIEGQEVVDKIAKVKTGIRAGMRDVPLETVVIEKVEVIENGQE